MRQFTMLLALILCCGAALAESYHSVVFRHKDGRETSVSYQEGMQMTFAGRVLTLSGKSVSNGLPASFSYDFDDLLGFRFDTDKGDNQFEGVEAANVDRMNVTIDGNTVRATGLEPGQPGFVFDLTGRILLQTRADANGNVTIDLSGLSARAAVVKINKFSTTISIR